MELSARPEVRRHSPTMHGGKNSLGLGGVLDYSSNVNPLGCPKAAARAAVSAVSRVSEYPDPGNGLLLAALAKYTGLGTGNLLAGNGAMEIIYNFCSTFLSRGSKVMIAVPTFAGYESASRLAGAPPSFFRTEDIEADAGRLAARVPRNGVLFLCNPNNPTGALVPRRTMLDIAAAARARSATVFVDECFVELVPGRDESVIRDVPRRGNLFVLRSLTKSFGLAGMRVGYAAGPSHAITALKKATIPWSVGLLAQRAAIAALSDTRHLARSKKLIGTESRFLHSEINKIAGLKCKETSTMFLLVKTKTSPAALQKRLLKRGILVRDCTNFRGLAGNHVRVAVRSRKENARLVRALREAA